MKCKLWTKFQLSLTSQNWIDKLNKILSVIKMLFVYMLMTSKINIERRAESKLNWLTKSCNEIESSEHFKRKEYLSWRKDKKWKNDDEDELRRRKDEQ